MYTITQAAKLMGISARRLRAMAIKGQIAGVSKLGSQWVLTTIPTRNKPGRPKKGTK